MYSVGASPLWMVQLTRSPFGSAAYYYHACIESVTLDGISYVSFRARSSVVTKQQYTNMLKEYFLTAENSAKSKMFTH